MLVDMIRDALGRDAQVLWILYSAEAAMECALQDLQAGRVDGAIGHLRIGLERVSRFLDEDARGQ